MPLSSSSSEPSHTHCITSGKAYSLSWTGKTNMQTVPVMTSGKTAIVVTGDANRNKVLTVPGGGMTTVKIELPNNWDSLMKDLGYKPLNNYYVKISQSVNTPLVQQPVQQKKHTNNNSHVGAQKRPTAEQYRKIRQEKGQSSDTQYRNSSSNYRQRHPNKGSYGSSNSNGKRRPNAEQYRKIRQQKGSMNKNN